MSRRIFRAMMGVTLTTLVVSVALFTAILFPYFEARLANELMNELAYISPNVEAEGAAWLEQLPKGENRLTLIDADGTVLLTARCGFPAGRCCASPAPSTPAWRC